MGKSRNNFFVINSIARLEHIAFIFNKTDWAYSTDDGERDSHNSTSKIPNFPMSGKTIRISKEIHPKKWT